MNKPVDKDSLQLNQPKRTPGHPTKSHIVKTKVDGKEKIIRFGQQGASTAGKPKEGESERMTAKRDSFKARHSANIAKGPSSAAYWANKVKWADGGSVRTNYAEGGSVQATPQNTALGSIANFLKKSYSPERTQQMQGIAEFLNIPALARTIESKSYGHPITNYGVANVPLIPDDTAEAAMALAEAVPVVGPLAKVARKVARKGARLVGEELNRAILDSSGPLAKFVPEAAKPMYVVKPKGGNWLSGSIEDVTHPLKQRTDARVATSQEEADNLIASGFVREKLGGEGYYLPPDPINKWIDQKLGDYIRNDLGTPEDPLRAMAENYAIDQPAKLAEVQARIKAFDDKMKRTARERGVPVENLTSMRQEMIGLEKEKALIEAKEALHMNFFPINEEYITNLGDTRYSQGFEPGGMGQSKQARIWEDLADAAIDEPIEAGSRFDKKILKNDPWLSKVPPETPVYGRYLSTNDLGFDHLIDELRNAVDPESGLPKNLLIDPKDLNKMTMADVVDKVSDINAWRATQKAEANQMLANNAATVVHKEYPTVPGTDAPNELGLRWVQFKPENTRSLPKGWTGKQEGKNYVIRSSKGQIEIINDTEESAIADLYENFPKYRPKNKALKEALKYEGDTMQHCVGGYCEDIASGSTQIFSLRDSRGMPHATVEVVPSRSNTIRQMNDGNPTDFDIEQIKGRRNGPPEKEYLPFVQDFVKSSNWKKVRDLENTSLKTLDQAFGQEYEMKKYFNKVNPDKKYLTQQEADDFIKEFNSSSDGYAAGGSVSVYNSDKIDEIINGIDDPQGYAKGGEVDVPDMDFKEDPETLRLYKYAMKQFMPNQEDTISTVSTGVQGRVGSGDLSAGIDMNRMTKGQQDQLMRSIAASYNVDLGDVNLNTRLEAPLDAKDIYVGMINGSIPIAEGRAMLGVQGIKTPYGSDVLGYNAGYSGKVGPGRLNVNVNKPKRGKPSAQVQYQIPFAEGGSVNYAKGGNVEDTLDTFVAPRYRKQRATPSSKETKAKVAEAAQFAADMVIPQSAFDVGLMLIPGGKVARKAGAALIALDAGNAEAGGLSALRKFKELINREAPEQANKIREALRLTKQTGREHSVIGLANEGGESVITRGTESAVLPNSFDLRTAKRAPGSPTIVDFHTHPGQGTIFETAPSRQDFQFYSSEYPSKAGRDLRTLVAVPPTKDGARRTTSYNFFETRDPAKVFDPRTLDAARFELQRAGNKGSFKSIQDDPALREYFDYGGDLASLLEDATPLALMRYRAGQGLGRHELQLGGAQLAPSPGATDIELFRQLERPAVELLKSKKFAQGGSVSVYDPDQVDAIANQFM